MSEPILSTACGRVVVGEVPPAARQPAERYLVAAEPSDDPKLVAPEPSNQFTIVCRLLAQTLVERSFGHKTPQETGLAMALTAGIGKLFGTVV